MNVLSAGKLATVMAILMIVAFSLNIIIFTVAIMNNVSTKKKMIAIATNVQIGK